MFWLDRILGGAQVLFDWGGNVGTTYLTYRKYVKYPERMQWIVNDVPAVVALGRRTAAWEHLPDLTFTTSFERLHDADILFAAGSLQFIEDPFGPLERAAALPRYVLVNKTPLYEREPKVTLQNLGTAIAPYHLFNRRAFLRKFYDLGYEPVDAWSTPGLGCEVPFFPAYSIGAFSGYFFEKRR
jgi:putative methyltransferase (TIGR04325 family)